LQVLGIRARVDGRDGVAGDLEVGILLARHLAERVPAQRHQAQERHQRELVAAYREFQKRHASPSGAGVLTACWVASRCTSTVSPFSRNNAPSVITGSPALMPLSSAMESAVMKATRTSRFCAVSPFSTNTLARSPSPSTSAAMGT